MSEAFGKFFKVLNKDGSTCHGGSGVWPLPLDSAAAEWTTPIAGKLIWCRNGYHLCRAEELCDWLGPAIFEAEYEGELKEKGNTVVVRKARLTKRLPWNDRIARQFLSDLAEQALPIYEKIAPADETPHKLLALAKRYLANNATKEELTTAYKEVGRISYRKEWDWQEYDHVPAEIINLAGHAVNPFTETAENDLKPASTNMNFQVKMAVELALRIPGRAAVREFRAAGNNDKQAEIALWTKTSKAAYPGIVAKLLSYLYSSEQVSS